MRVVLKVVLVFAAAWLVTSTVGPRLAGRPLGRGAILVAALVLTAAVATLDAVYGW